MTQSIVCGACGAGVRYGRLSCPECGEMLATVAGAVRRPSSIASATEAPVEVAVAAPADVVDVVAPKASAVVAAPPAWPDAGALDVHRGEFPDRSEPNDPDPRDAEPFDPPAFDRAPSIAAAPAGSGSVAGVIGGAPWTVTAATPGAYLPPVLQPAGPPAPARAWAGYGAADAAPTGVGTGGSAAAATDAAADDASAVDKATEFIGWLAIAGGAMSAAGFLLPWSSLVIGARGADYVDLWGLAGPGHVVVVLAVLGIIAAAALRERVPLWLGIGLPGLGVGALLVGLVWPYLLALPGAQIGATAVLLGALLLVGAGIAALVLDRHARGERAV